MVGGLEPSASVINVLLDLYNSLDPSQPHSIIAKCYSCSLCFRLTYSRYFIS